VLRLQQEKDVDTLRQAAVLLERENQKLTQKIVELTRELMALKGQAPEQLTMKLAELEQQLAARTKALFGDSTEKRAHEKAPKRKAVQHGHGPREQPALPLIEVPHTIDAEPPVCSDCGKPVEPWKDQFEDSEEVDVITRQFVLKKHRRQKYRCQCHKCIVTAPAPLKLVDGGRYSIDFAVHIAISKYLDHLPLERQVRIMRREGLLVDSQTLWDQVDVVAALLRPAHARLLGYILGKSVIGADETWWRLMGEKGKREGGAGKRWQVWAACAEDAVYYNLEDSRSAAAGENLLGGYDGIAMCDGYSVYDALAKKNQKLRLAHCWSHVRRKFVEIEDFFPKQAGEAISMIGELFAIDALCPTGPPGDELRHTLRQERARPVIARIRDWAMSVQALPESGLRKAIAYMIGMWKGLTRFLDDPKIPLHNNATERALRGIVVGRKNHYGSRSKRGTEVAAILYSLVESAKLADVDPHRYLREAVHAALGGEQIPLPHELAAAAATTAA
jgi:transposase